MICLQKILSEIYRILKKNMAIVSQHTQYIFPEGFDFEIPFTEIREHVDTHYLGYSIYEIATEEESFYACIQSDAYLLDEKMELALSMMAMALGSSTSSAQPIKSLLAGTLNDGDLFKLQQAYDSRLNAYVLLLQCPQQDKSELREIILHSLDTEMVFDYQQHLFVLSKEKEIDQACNNLAANILSDLLIECCIAIGGKAHQIQDLPVCYQHCLQAFQLKSMFQLSDPVIHYERMYLYRIVAGMDDNLKQDILNRVFHEKTVEIFDKEMTRTIDAYFQNNLNVTDTANAIFIHRNTLLYRIDKIHHHTGFDLKNMEDSWLFKLAWLIRKEKQVNQKESIA